MGVMANATDVIADLATKVRVVDSPTKGRVSVTIQGVTATGEIISFGGQIEGSAIVMVKLDGTGDVIGVPDTFVTEETS